MKEKIKAIKEYLKYFPDDSYVKQKLELYQYADELDLKLNGSYYPRMDWHYCIINSQIKAGKKYNLSNRKTNYKINDEDTIIIWSEPLGRLAFVGTDYQWDITGEWEEFMNVLKSYEPLDCNEINNIYVYNLENGKRLIEDYKEIIDDFLKKVNKKITEVEIERTKKQLELLNKELEEIKQS